MNKQLHKIGPCCIAKADALLFVQGTADAFNQFHSYLQSCVLLHMHQVTHKIIHSFYVCLANYISPAEVIQEQDVGEVQVCQSKKKFHCT